MIDSDNVRPPPGNSDVPNRLVIATIYYFDGPVPADFVEFFENTIKPEMAAAGGTVLAYFVPEPGENTFPALPVRENENVFVWFARFSDLAAYDLYLAALERSVRWHEEIIKELTRRIKGPPELLKLSPTARSLL